MVKEKPPGAGAVLTKNLILVILWVAAYILFGYFGLRLALFLSLGTSFILTFIFVILAVVIMGYFSIRFNKFLGIILTILAAGYMFFWLIIVAKEELCYMPDDVPFAMLKKEAVPELAAKNPNADNFGSGYYYADRCEHELSMPFLLWSEFFPAQKNLWHEQIKAEIGDLIIQSHLIRITSIFELKSPLKFQNEVDLGNDKSHYLYSSEEMGFELDRSSGDILRIENYDYYPLNENLSSEQLETAAQEIIRRLKSHFIAINYIYSIGQKDNNSFYRWESKDHKLEDGTPAFMQIALDQFGNLLNYHESR